MANEFVFPRDRDPLILPWLQTVSLLPILLMLLALMLGAVQAQTSVAPTPSDSPYVVDGVSDTMAYSVGRSLKINGTVKNGAIALGGDVIVHGIVEGDVAAIGGSVIQMEGARIGGDVMVVGGAYRHMDSTPLRNGASQTVMYAGYEEQLRNIMRNPADLLTPRWSAAYIGLRLLAILFWFVVSLAITAAMPGTISRGIERLQLSSLRVAVIGFLGALVIGVVVPSALHYLPSPISLVVGLLALLLILIAGLFGRVIIYAATGRLLQRKFLKTGKHSESVALLLGTTFWIVLSSLPYIWPLVVTTVLVTSLGLALTARYRVGWRRQEA
ncbi:MAG TPA: polymer-forming cytoskeletal protein [Pyrinomonadaceae bacterium]|nr:polymer-forming cytoskeletal protein [Pyrinomonadaceae bacterium]